MTPKRRPHRGSKNRQKTSKNDILGGSKLGVRKWSKMPKNGRKWHRISPIESQYIRHAPPISVSSIYIIVYTPQICDFGPPQWGRFVADPKEIPALFLSLRGTPNFGVFSCFLQVPKRCQKWVKKWHYR